MISYKGTVKNGVVVLEPGANLPEGTVVRGEAEAPAQDFDPGLVPVWRMPELAVDTGIPDLAVNIDRYRYGRPQLPNRRL